MTWVVKDWFSIFAGFGLLGITFLAIWFSNGFIWFAFGAVPSAFFVRKGFKIVRRKRKR